MAVTCELIGGLGNHFYQIASVVAYAKKYNMPYCIPQTQCAYNKPSFGIVGTCPFPYKPIVYSEPTNGKNPFFHDIPNMRDIMLVGYWQSFLYFDWCRQDVLNVFNFPNNIMKGIVSLHVRRGDAIGQENTFPMAPIEYYSKCITYMNEKGYNEFLVFSDDIPWCKQIFTEGNYPGCVFKFSEGNSDLDDYITLSNCEHHILARSTFSFSAAWLCQNPDKIVLCPPFPLFKNCHKEMIPDYYTVIDCEITTTENWADEYKNKQTATSTEKKSLPNVTLLCLATRDVESAANALVHSMKGLDYAKVRLVSDYRPQNLPDNIEWKQVHKMSSIDDWNHEVFYNLWKYFDTEFVLFIHPDGFVVNPQSWKDEFLQYDYIGPPWDIECAKAIQGGRDQEIVRVGNSVSLRSRKICKVPSEIGLPWRRYNNDFNEDTQITAHNRKAFLQEGIKYAPLELAVQFGREGDMPENVHIESPFLFHKWDGRNKHYPRL